MRTIGTRRHHGLTGRLRRAPGIPLVRALLAAALVATPACTPAVLPHTLVDASGDPITLDEVEPIITNSSLSEDEQREQLRELGITDESLIDLLQR